MSSKEILSWSEVDRACQGLRDWILRPVSEVIPISRGGLVPGAILAYMLDLPVKYVFDPKSPALYSPRCDLLVVDDVSDTGATIRCARNMFPNAMFVALFAKPAGFAACDEYAVAYPQDVWLTFPWSPNDALEASIKVST